MELRFIIRDGKRILQFRTGGKVIGHGELVGIPYINREGWSEWQDVPLVEDL